MLAPERDAAEHGDRLARPDRADAMGGGGGGGGMGTLQALLTELSGLKKPRGFFNRSSAGRSACGRSRRPSTGSS